MKDPERILVCAKRMNFASFRIPTSPGRSNEVSGGCVSLVKGMIGDGLTSSHIRFVFSTTVPHPTEIFEYS